MTNHKNISFEAAAQEMEANALEMVFDLVVLVEDGDIEEAHDLVVRYRELQSWIKFFRPDVDEA